MTACSRSLSVLIAVAISSERLFCSSMASVLGAPVSSRTFNRVKLLLEPMGRLSSVDMTGTSPVIRLMASSMLLRMKGAANVTKGLPRLGSNLSAAFISPMLPSLIRSSVLNSSLLYWRASVTTYPILPVIKASLSFFFIIFFFFLRAKIRIFVKSTIPIIYIFQKNSNFAS